MTVLSSPGCPLKTFLLGAGLSSVSLLPALCTPRANVVCFFSKIRPYFKGSVATSVWPSMWFSEVSNTWVSCNSMLGTNTWEMQQSGVQELDIQVSVQHHGLAFSAQTEPLMLCSNCTLWLVFGSLSSWSAMYSLWVRDGPSGLMLPTWWNGWFVPDLSQRETQNVGLVNDKRVSVWWRAWVLSKRSNRDATGNSVLAVTCCKTTAVCLA